MSVRSDEGRGASIASKQAELRFSCLFAAMSRRPAAAEPPEKRHCASPVLVDLTQDDDDFEPPPPPRKALSLDAWKSSLKKRPASDALPSDSTPTKIVAQSPASGTMASASSEDRHDTSAAPHDKEKLFYYIANFWKVTTTVEAAYGKIFLPSEHEFLRKIAALHDGSLRLFLRMLSRAPTWFRFKDLESRYSHEIPSIPAAAERLVQDGLAVQASVNDLSEANVLQQIVELLKKDEINLLLTVMQCPQKSSVKRKELVELLMKFVKSPPRSVQGHSVGVLAHIMDAAGDVVALHPDLKSFCQRLFRLFFLADGLDHKELFLADANIIRFPKYSLSGTGSLFPTRLHLTAWEECRSWQQRFDEAVACVRRDEAARAMLMAILLDAAEWLLHTSNELADPLFLGGSKTAPARESLQQSVRAAIGAERTLPECLVKSKISFIGMP